LKAVVAEVFPVPFTCKRDVGETVFIQKLTDAAIVARLVT
jgi:hypothetical protein